MAFLTSEIAITFSASASMTIGFLHRFTNLFTNERASIPIPLPNTMTSCFSANSSTGFRWPLPNRFPFSFRTTKSGVRQLIAHPTFSGAATVTQSAPHRKAARPASATAPMYSGEPPTTSTRPLSPFFPQGFRLGSGGFLRNFISFRSPASPSPSRLRSF